MPSEPYSGAGQRCWRIAVPQPVLHGAQRALRDAIGRPRAHRVLRVLAGLGEIRQPLQADALAVVAVAGGAGEIHHAGAAVEHRLADGGHLLLLGMGELRLDLHAARLVGDEGDEILHVGRAARAGEAARDDVLGVEPLNLLHAPQQPLLEIHDLVGIREVARQLARRRLRACRRLGRDRRSRARRSWCRASRSRALRRDRPRGSPDSTSDR